MGWPLDRSREAPLLINVLTLLGAGTLRFYLAPIGALAVLGLVAAALSRSR